MTPPQATAEELIGAGALAALAAHGFTVHRRAEYVRWVEEVEDSKLRIKRVATATIKAAGCASALVEIEVLDGLHRILVCAPNRDEEELLRRLVAAIKGAAPEADRAPVEQVELAGVRELPGKAPGGVR